MFLHHIIIVFNVVEDLWFVTVMLAYLLLLYCEQNSY